MVAIIAIAFTSFLFLLTKNDRWDNLSQSLAEVGLVSAVVMLFPGLYGQSLYGEYGGLERQN